LFQEQAWTWNYFQFAESAPQQMIDLAESAPQQMVDLAAAAPETASEVSALSLSLLCSHSPRLRPAQV
jgi:hypothetical protein